MLYSILSRIIVLCVQLTISECAVPMQIDGSDTIDPEVFALLGSAVVCLVVFTADPASLTRTKALHALAAISAYLADRHCAAPKMEASRKNLDLFTRALLFDAQETVSHDGGQCVAILGRLLSRGSHPFSDDILGLFVNEAFADSAAPAYRCEVSRVLVGVDSPIKFWRFWDHLVTFSTAACTGKTSSLALEAADASSTEQRADRELAIAAVAALTTTTISYFGSVRAGGPPAKVHTFADDADKILGTWLAVEDEDLDSPCLWLLARLEANDLLNALSVKDRTAIFAPLSKLYGKTSGSDIGALLKRVLTTLHVEAVEIVSVLEAALTSSAEVAVNGSSDEDAGDGVASAAAAASRHSKRRRVQGGDVDLRSLSTEYILTTEYILDILQFKDSATIGHAHLLFDPLFDFLTYVYPIARVYPPCHCDPDVRRKDLRSIVDVVGWCCRGLFLAEVGSVHDLTVVGCSVLDCRYCLGLRSETQFSVEHIKQTVLDILSSLCRDIDTDTIPKKALNAETIVKCIKSTNNPQTHQCVDQPSRPLSCVSARCMSGGTPVMPEPSRLAATALVEGTCTWRWIPAVRSNLLRRHVLLWRSFAAHTLTRSTIHAVETDIPSCCSRGLRKSRQKECFSPSCRFSPSWEQQFSSKTTTTPSRYAWLSRVCVAVCLWVGLRTSIGGSEGYVGACVVCMCM